MARLVGLAGLAALVGLLVGTNVLLRSDPPVREPRESPPLNEPDMPAFSESFEGLATDYYRIAWSQDGYPGREEADGSVYEHPIYPIYVLQDYIKQWSEHPTTELENGIGTVAQAAVERLDRFRGALVMWYEPDPSAARLYRRHFSALTQSYYALWLYKAGDVLKDQRLKRAAGEAIDSLFIPVERGGVLHRDSRGISLAEVPQEPNSLILNGWQSALMSIHGYGELSGSLRAAGFVKRSAKAMARLLPLYDVPNLANSRYGLTGFLYVRLSLSERVSVRLERMSVTVPGEGSFDVMSVPDPSRWQNHLVAEDFDDGWMASTQARANIVVSLASLPRHNRIGLDLDAQRPVDAKLEAFVGRYDPLTSASLDGRWMEVGRLRIGRGTSRTQIALPWRVVRSAAYPTNFAKVIEGHNTNVYHTTHIRRLEELAEVTGIRKLSNWAHKWKSYMCRWGEMKTYEGLWGRRLSGESAPVGNLCD
jgi:hypothetical protein